MTTEQITSPQTQKGNCLLRCCLIALLFFFLVACCLGTLVVLPFVTGFNPLGLEWQNEIRELLPWDDFFQIPSLIPELPDLWDESFDPFLEDDDSGLDFPDPGPLAPTRPAEDAMAIPLSTYIAGDFPAVFSYPENWDIEVEDSQVTFYDPDSYTILSVGEELVEPGKTASQVSADVIANLESEAEGGTFKIIENSPWSVPTGDDAFLNAFEWIDFEGNYQWAFDLEIVSGESNVFFFLIGDDPDLAPVYAELIEIIAISFSR